MMDLYVTEPPYYARDGKIQLPRPSNAEALEFLRAAVRHAFRGLMRNSWGLQNLLGAGELPMRPTSGTEAFGPEQVIDLANLTQQQYDKVIESASAAMYEALSLSRVWNPVLLQATRALAGKWGAGWIATSIRDVFVPGKDGRSFERSMHDAHADLHKAAVWTKLGAVFGEKLTKGAVGQLRSPAVQRSQLLAVRSLLDQGVDPGLLGMVGPDAAEQFSPAMATEMRRKGIRALTASGFAKALDAELSADPLTVVRLHDSLAALPDRDRQAGITKGGGWLGLSIIKSWASAVNREGGADPLGWLERTAAPFKLGKSFCARVLVEAFGRLSL